MTKNRNPYSPFIVATVMFLLSVSLCITAHSASDQDRGELVNLFRAANEYYQQKKFDEAVMVYEQIISMGGVNPVVLYNAGNAYQMSGESGMAVVMYEKALRYLPRDRDIKYNLILVSPTEDVPTPFFLFIPLVKAHNFFSLRELVGLLCVCYMLVCLSLGMYFLARGKTKQRALKSMAYAAMMSLIVVMCFFVPKYYDQVVAQRVVVIEDDVLAMSGPGEDYSIQFRISEGMKARLVGETEQWARIRVNRDKEGYVKRTSIAEI